jgi:signal transduction histidine kinase
VRLAVKTGVRELDLENLALYEGDDPVLHAAETRITDLVSGIVQNCEPQSRSRPVSHADPDRLSQAMKNLLANSLDFTAPGGTVEVTVAATAAGAAIQVSDTGVGIAAEDLPHIFERFYRADSSRSRVMAFGGLRRERTGGSGIGLSITKAIVEAHGGSISAQSEPGKGSVFAILIPARARPSRLTARSARLPGTPQEEQS